MLLILGIVLILLFVGLGFAAHILFWGIVLGLIVLVADRVVGHSRS